MHRAFRAIRQIRRLPELLDCRSITREWSTLALAYLGLRPDSSYPFSIRLATGPFEFREPSDVPTFWQIFFAHLYPVKPTDRLIIDAGANIGAFTLYALIHAPRAHVIAVEPAPDSCDRLRRVVQTHGFTGRCTILQSALSSEVGRTTIQMIPGSQFRVTGKGGASVNTVNLDSLVAAHETVDLLKLDAEGAEYQTLPAASKSALRRIRRIEMEYHPGGDTRALLHRLTDSGFRLEQARDNSSAAGYGIARLSRTG